MKVSILISSYKRPHLLRLGLSSFVRYKPHTDYEIIVLNDGIQDETEQVCKEFSSKLNIKYIFTGHRNLDGVMKHRVSGFAMNVGIKQSTGDIILFSCPEMYQINEAYYYIINNLIRNPKTMTIPEKLFFDNNNVLTKDLLKLSNEQLLKENLTIEQGVALLPANSHSVMPFFMGVYKKELVDIGGYDEDFIGYAGEDNDLIDRLKLNGLTHLKTKAFVIHLYHENHCSGFSYNDNPAWQYNYNLYQERKGVVVRNQNREWGKIDE